MKMTGYSDPLRGMERKMAPDFAQRQMRDPGLKTITPKASVGMRPPRVSSGLGSLRHTMPHLRRLSGTPHYQGGGLTGGNPLGELIAASRPNNFNADPQFRSFMQLLNQTPMTDRSLLQAPSPVAQFVYQEGGEVEAEPDMQDLASPEEEMSPAEQQQKQVVLNAMAALDGESPDPEADLKAFIDAFGPRALADLQQLVESKHAETQTGDEEEEEEEEGGSDNPEEEEEESDLAGAGGGLLHGRGTGQSDEIHGSTPSGRPVLLSDGEYVIDAPTVAALGDGSTKAGARRLDDMRKQIRRNAYGHDKQSKPMAKGGTAVVLKLK